MSLEIKRRRDKSLRRGATGPVWIAGGIATLLAAACWPVIPVVTGMSLIALGATLAVISRVESARHFRLLVFVHVVVYASLYVLFVGSVCHGATIAPHHGLGLLQTVDLLASTVPMAVAARVTVASLTGGGARAAR
jgi:hypothetical protein